MSRIGKRILVVPEGTTVEVNGSEVKVTGKLGSMTLSVKPGINVVVSDGNVTVTRDNDSKELRSLHGTTNALISNMLIGVSEGFQKGLEAVGVGYKFTVAGNKITVSAGYSHPVEVIVPSDLKVESVSNTEITVSGIDKQKVSEFAANVRKIREPEPYKGKGIRYKGEYIRRKEGKKASK